MIDLKTIIHTYPQCLCDKKSLRTILLDRYPCEKRIVNILTIIFESGIADEIKEKTSITFGEIQSFILRVEDEYGIVAKYSREAILIWARAYDIPTVEVSVQTESFTLGGGLSRHAVSDIDDFNITRRIDGYYIKRFAGFEKEKLIIPSIINGKKIKGIAEGAFEGCVTIRTIHISEGIKIIENKAFKNCKNLENILLPNTLRRIGGMPSEYGTGAFMSTNIKTIVIPDNVEFLGPYTFADCRNLSNIVLPDNLTVICKGTFEYCRLLSAVRLPKRLLKIEEGAFSYCNALKEVHIPSGTEIIEAKAFVGAGLTAVYIPPSVTKICPFKGTFGADTLEFEDGALTIYCTAGSAAMEYARKHNIKCERAQFKKT